MAKSELLDCVDSGWKRDVLSVALIDSLSGESDMNGYEIDSSNVKHRTVLEMGRMYFEGNIIPPAWFDCLRYDSESGPGRPHANAIIILSEIVYWYRPVEVRDESTGRLVGYRKKFKGDRLQRSRHSFEEQFGFSKKQVTDAIAFLEKRGIIKKEIVKTMTTEAGQQLGNVMYLEIIPDGLRRITPIVTVTTLEPTGKRVVPTSNSYAPTSKTNTETTTETTYSGGAKRPKVAAATDAEKRLMAVGGLNLTQARTALEHQEFTPELLERIKTWAYKLRDAGKSPGRILCGYTNSGLLPDDLPEADIPQDAIPQLEFDEVTGQPIVPEALRRLLEAESKQKHLYHRG